MRAIASILLLLAAAVAHATEAPEGARRFIGSWEHVSTTDWQQQRPSLGVQGRSTFTMRWEILPDKTARLIERVDNRGIADAESGKPLVGNQAVKEPMEWRWELQDEQLILYLQEQDENGTLRDKRWIAVPELKGAVRMIAIVRPDQTLVVHLSNGKPWVFPTEYKRVPQALSD